MGAKPGGALTYVFGIIFAKNCMKLKKLYGGACLTPPRSAIEICSNNIENFNMIAVYSDEYNG